MGRGKERWEWRDDWGVRPTGLRMDFERVGKRRVGFEMLSP